MKYFFIILFCLVSIISNAQNNLKTLERAYKKKSVKFLQKFCDNWSKEIQPISDIEYMQLNDTLKNAYDLFKVFFNPFDSSILKYSYFRRSPDDLRYLVLPGSISIYYQDTTNSSKHEKKLYNNADDPYKERFGQLIYSISDFRPKTNYPEIKSLYLTQRYDTIMQMYFGDKGIKVDYFDRKKFLDTCLQVTQGWMRHMFVTTNPIAGIIIFGKGMEYAKVIVPAGEAIFKHENDNWIFQYYSQYFID